MTGAAPNVQGFCQAPGTDIVYSALINFYKAPAGTAVDLSMAAKK